MAEEIKTPEPTPVPEPTPAPEPTAKTYSEEEYKALETQLENLKQSTKDNEDFKKKFEESEQARKDFEYKTKVGTFVKSLGLKDDIYEKYVTDIIVEKGLKFEGEKLIGGTTLFQYSKKNIRMPSNPKSLFPNFQFILQVRKVQELTRLLSVPLWE